MQSENDANCARPGQLNQRTLGCVMAAAKRLLRFSCSALASFFRLFSCSLRRSARVLAPLTCLVTSWMYFCMFLLFFLFLRPKVLSSRIFSLAFSTDFLEGPPPFFFGGMLAY